MNSLSNIIRSLLKFIGFVAFILLSANAVLAQSSLKATGKVASASHTTITEVEPLLLLLIGLLLFSVATGIKLKLLKR
jgi:hypothetical protein